MNKTIIQAKGLHKKYSDGEKELLALKDVNLDIYKGEFLSITGPSGSGKSTLLHILGILDSPTKGVLKYDEADISSMSEDEKSTLRNRKIGFIFQFFHLFSELTVIENISLPLMIKNKRNRLLNHEHRAVEHLVQEIGLEKRSLHRPNQLSGGEQQRVAIARALVNQPEIILADEPTGNLDKENRKSIYRLLWDLNKNKGITIVIATHDEAFAETASRMLKLVDGSIM
ncbi:MAG: ABC transporter ATP-binding protein [bacterium]|nr:ABC transporter ATP-binding protein [bacterium]